MYCVIPFIRLLCSHILEPDITTKHIPITKTVLLVIVEQKGKVTSVRSPDIHDNACSSDLHFPWQGKCHYSLQLLTFKVLNF